LESVPAAALGCCNGLVPTGLQTDVIDALARIFARGNVVHSDGKVDSWLSPTRAKDKI